MRVTALVFPICIVTAIDSSNLVKVGQSGFHARKASRPPV